MEVLDEQEAVDDKFHGFVKYDVRKMIWGLILAVRIGREWRIDVGYLQHFLEQNMADKGRI